MAYFNDGDHVRTLHTISARKGKPELPRGAVGHVVSLRRGDGLYNVEFGARSYRVYENNLEPLCCDPDCEITVSEPGALCPSCEYFYLGGWRADEEVSHA